MFTLYSPQWWTAVWIEMTANLIELVSIDWYKYMNKIENNEYVD